MTIDNEYETEAQRYQVKLMKELKKTVRAFDSKIEEFLNELRDHWSEGGTRDNGISRVPGTRYLSIDKERRGIEPGPRYPNWSVTPS